MKNINDIVLNGRTIGPNHPVFIVFEAGPTHDGLPTAKKLVDMAVQAGAEAIKFQMVNASQMVSDPNLMFSYERLLCKKTGKTEIIKESLLEILKRRELSQEEWSELITYCNKAGITFFTTVSNEEEIQFLADHKIEMVKICSGDINYNYLLKIVSNYDWIVQIDTGSASFGEIADAVDIIERCGKLKIIINHCPSGYPAKLYDINLQQIKMLMEVFAYPIAFSDHSCGDKMDIAAVALGASIIEKTVSLDRTTKSPEHIMSLEPEEAQAFVTTIKEIETALGKNERFAPKNETNNAINVRRSLFAARNIKKGEVFEQNMLSYSRPGNGIPADMDTLILGKTAKVNIENMTMLTFSHFC